MADPLKMDHMAVYHIQIQGSLAPHWSDYLNGLTIKVSHEDEYPITTLSGEIVDQAALLGVLTNLYNLGYPILEVEHQIISLEEK